MTISAIQLVQGHGVYKYGDRGQDVKFIQGQLSRAGFNPGNADGTFGDQTRDAVRLYEIAGHAERVDGVIDATIAALLDHDAMTGPAPKPIGEPLIHTASGFPHDDLASLIAFYGDPRNGASVNARWLSENVVSVPVPFLLHFDKTPVTAVPFHRKAAQALHDAFDAIWNAYGQDQNAIVAARLDKYSGTGNYRMVRGSATSLSCHAFWAAIDIDAEDLPLGHPNPVLHGMPDQAVKAFKDAGFFWGNDYHARKDPMHFQAAHE